MMIGIWSMSKHPWWWWLLEFNSCSSILDDNSIDFTHVQKSLVIVVSFVRFGDNLKVFQLQIVFIPVGEIELRLGFTWHYLSFFMAENLTFKHVNCLGKIISWDFNIILTKDLCDDKALKLFGGNWDWSCDQFLVNITIIWSQWQLKLVTWPIFSKDYQNLVAMKIEINCVTNFW